MKLTEGKVVCTFTQVKFHLIPEGNPVAKNPILNFFDFAHLPVALQGVSGECYRTAMTMNAMLPETAEKSAGLRKLLEAKDCFVRAALSAPVEPAVLTELIDAKADIAYIANHITEDNLDLKHDLVVGDRTVFGYKLTQTLLLDGKKYIVTIEPHVAPFVSR